MLIVNGSTSLGQTRFWYQIVNLQNGTEYRFRAFARSCYDASESMDLSLNGATVPGSDVFVGTTAWGAWDKTFTYAGPSGAVELGIHSNSLSFSGNDVAVDDISLVANTVQLTGTLVLQDTGVFAVNRIMGYSVMQGTSSIASGSVVASASSSSFSIQVPSSAEGSAALVFDGSSFLQKTTLVTLTGVPALVGTVTCQNGDVDASGEVDAADIDAVIADFGGMTGADTDVDVSGEVDAADIDVAIANFGGVDQ